MSASFEHLRFLLVDDDWASLEGLSEALALRMGDVLVDTSDTAARALERLNINDYDAVISDIKMPGMDGLELLSRIQENWPDIPTLLITGHGETDLAIQALRAGAYDLVQKPIDRDYIVAALRRATEARSLRRDVRAKQEALEFYAAHLEKMVEERTEELNQALLAKSEFVALVSHELRTPTTTILGSSRLLNSSRNFDEETKRELLEAIESESTRLYQLIENLLAAGRADLGQIIQVEEIELPQAISDVIASKAWGSGGRAVNTQFDAPDRRILADSTSLRQVLTNLLSNANKYSPAGSEIRVTTRASDQEVVVSVLDAGPGVAEEDLGRIFNSFFRAEKTSSMASGKGLGLAVCKKLIEAQGGRIWAENGELGGLKVSFTLAVADRQPAQSDPRGTPIPLSPA